MRLNYSVTFDDFTALQRPFTTRAGNNVGFKAAVVACGLMSLLGVWCLSQGLGIPVGSFLIGLGVLAALASYWFDKKSVSNAKRKYDQDLSEAYHRVHCRDRRAFEADEENFILSCACGTIARPWTELSGFSESKTHFAINTKAGGHAIPKSAFPSEAEITDFRVLALRKLRGDSLLPSRHFDFRCTLPDYWAARLLHIVRAGGWQTLSKSLLTYACMLYGAYVIWDAVSARSAAGGYAVVAGLLSAPLVKFVGARRKHYYGPLRVYYGESGLHLVDPFNQARYTWNQFVGFVEDASFVLLYHNPKLYRVIPKRALNGQNSEFLSLMKSKLPKYDHRNPKIGSIEPQSQNLKT